VGWQWQQTFGDVSASNAVKYYQIQLLPYFQGTGYFENIISLKKLYTNELTFEVPFF